MLQHGAVAVVEPFSGQGQTEVPTIVGTGIPYVNVNSASTARAHFAQRPSAGGRLPGRARRHGTRSEAARDITPRSSRPSQGSRWCASTKSASELEPEVGLEPTTCALRGGWTVSDSVPVSPGRSRSVLVREPRTRIPGTDEDSVGRAGTQLLGQSWDKAGRNGAPAAHSCLDRTAAGSEPNHGDRQPSCLRQVLSGTLHGLRQKRSTHIWQRWSSGVSLHRRRSLP